MGYTVRVGVLAWRSIVPLHRKTTRSPRDRVKRIANTQFKTVKGSKGPWPFAAGGI